MPPPQRTIAPDEKLPPTRSTHALTYYDSDEDEEDEEELKRQLDALPDASRSSRRPPLPQTAHNDALAHLRELRSDLHAEHGRLGLLQRPLAHAELDVRGAEPRGDAVLLREEDAFNGIERRRRGVERGDGVRARGRDLELGRSGQEEDEVEEGGKQLVEDKGESGGALVAL